MIHYVSGGFFLAVFVGDYSDSVARGNALSRGDDISARRGVAGPRSIHDDSRCNRAPGLAGCSYVCGNAPAFVETEDTEWVREGFHEYPMGGRS